MSYQRGEPLLGKVEINETKKETSAALDRGKARNTGAEELAY